MIINTSRAKVYKHCKRKAFNNYIRELEGSRSINLVDGGAMHEGIAVGLATRDWSRAIEAARVKFDVDKTSVTTLPEEGFIFEAHWELVQKMISCYKDNYEQEEYQVLQPECSFDVELPNSHHHCLLVHWWDRETNTEQWGHPPVEKILRKAVARPHFFGRSTLEDPAKCPCYLPHRLVGKTDAVVLWTTQGTRNIWLLEHKSTAISGEQFWNQFQLDMQPTSYIYGIWKQLGIRPRGVLVNAITKPSEKQVASWNSRRKYGPPKNQVDYISYERQPFLRDEEALVDFAEEMRGLCDEWEDRLLSGYWPKENVAGACVQYNRVCDYFHCCLGHDTPSTFEALVPRKLDYVNEKQFKILDPEYKLPTVEVPLEEVVNGD